MGRRTLRERSWGEPGGCRRTGHIREDAARSRVGTSFVCSTQLPRITPLAPKIAEAFDHEAFAFELKHDGWRGLLQLDRRGSAGFISRADRALRRFDSLAMAIAETLPVENAVLDGEVVCLDAEGRSQFSGLSRRSVQPLFYCFDILWLDGEDLRDETLRKRRELLRVLLPRQGVDVFLADQVIGKGVKLRRGLPARPRGDRRQAARLALSARARQESRVQGAQPGVLAEARTGRGVQSTSAVTASACTLSTWKHSSAPGDVTKRLATAFAGRQRHWPKACGAPGLEAPAVAVFDEHHPRRNRSTQLVARQTRTR